MLAGIKKWKLLLEKSKYETDEIIGNILPLKLIGAKV
jgi:hypothetical protein